MANQIQRVRDRDALPARREPYWITLREGHYLGFRKVSASSSGTWLARRRDKRTGDQVRKPLGKFDELPDAERYDAARKGAEEWFEHLAAAAGLPAATTSYTLRHSTMTDLVAGGLDLLTVAQISGTSVAMIEEHYGHLRQDLAAEALARLVL